MIRQRPPQVVLRPLRERTQVLGRRQRPAQRRGLDRQDDVVLAHGPTRRARLFLVITLEDPPFSLFAIIKFAVLVAQVSYFRRRRPPEQLRVPRRIGPYFWRWWRRGLVLECFLHGFSFVEEVYRTARIQDTDRIQHI